MYYDLALKNGTIVTPLKSFTGEDIAVRNGKIAFIGKLDNSDSADIIYDAEGKHILPGIIDAHVHFRDPGLTSKEDFETGSMAAASGGITMIADMPNVIPPTSNTELFNGKIQIAQEKSYIDFALFALFGNNTSLTAEQEITALKKAGVLGFKVFLGTSTGDIAPPLSGELFKLMENSAELDIRIGFHCENSDINFFFTSINKKINNKPKNYLLSQARPVISEVLAIQTAICYAKYTRAKIHIHHVTSSDGALLIAEAKQKGINITSETCPHYLLLDSGEEKAHKVYPPIRDKSHREGLWNAILNGTIDMLASDHAPHLVSEKNLPVWKAPAGLSGVETFVSLFLNEVNKGALTINDFVRLASEAPAKTWGIYPNKGSLLPGTDADFTIVDMKKNKTIYAKDFYSKSKTSPFEGVEVQGIPAATIVRGVFIMKDGRLTGKKGYGKFIK